MHDALACLARYKRGVWLFYKWTLAWLTCIGLPPASGVSWASAVLTPRPAPLYLLPFHTPYLLFRSPSLTLLASPYFLVSPAAAAATFSPFLILCALFFSVLPQHVLVISTLMMHHQTRTFRSKIASKKYTHSHSSFHVFHVITKGLLMHTNAFSYTYQYTRACTPEPEVLAGTYCLSYSVAFPVTWACSPTRTGIQINWHKHDYPLN